MPCDESDERVRNAAELPNLNTMDVMRPESIRSPHLCNNAPPIIESLRPGICFLSRAAQH
jgi:hypothetical protein